jgi:hypothetical protein
MKFDIHKMIAESGTSWAMGGTERTYTFVRLLNANLGTVGFRCTGGIVRVRIEPSNSAAAPELIAAFPPSAGWKQPSGSVGGKTFRFSKVFTNADEAIAAVEYAIKALGKEGVERRGGYSRFWRMAIRQHLPAPVASAA